jgi:hypothetical protein
LSPVVRGIQDPRLARELQTVEDCRRRTEVDVLRAEVSVALDDPLFPNPPFQHRAQAFEHPQLALRDLGDRVHGKAELPAGQLLARLQDAPTKTILMLRGIERHRPGLPVEARQELGGGSEKLGTGGPVANPLVEEVASAQPTHPDKPIHRRPRAVQGQLAPRRQDQRNDAQVDLWREPTVQTDLIQAPAPAALECSEVQELVAHGLLQLVRELPGQKHPRHVGLDGRDRGGPRRVAVGATKELDLRRESDGFLGDARCPAALVAGSRR